MNMGIGDALDLGWKLSAVLSGWGGDALLPSYEIERRQVHQRVIEESVANHAASTTKLVVAGIEHAGDAGDGIRALVGDTIAATKRREFYSLGVVLGSRYRESPVLASQVSRTGDAAHTIDSADSIDYTPLARPGCLAPHAWLDAGCAKGASLYDHFSSSGFTLLVTTQPAAEAAQTVVQAATGLGMPVKLLVQPAKKLNALYGCAYAIIRPDQYIAWCGDSLDDALDMLARASGKVLEPVT